MDYILYDHISGEIRAYGDSPDAESPSLTAQALGLSWMEGSARPSTHRVIGGVITAIDT